MGVIDIEAEFFGGPYDGQTITLSSIYLAGGCFDEVRFAGDKIAVYRITGERRYEFVRFEEWARLGTEA